MCVSVCESVCVCVCVCARACARVRVRVSEDIHTWLFILPQAQKFGGLLRAACKNTMSDVHIMLVHSCL
jgi:hypothetical protein